MASVGETAGAAKGREEEDAIQRAGRNVEKDKRDIADLWTAALKAYKNVVGFELTVRAANTEELIAIGVNEMEKFNSFRRDRRAKVDKLRSLFATNLDLLEEGSKQLAAAATPAFPPAAAIGTAMTWMLSACRQVSTDYDVVEVFFNDMNGFLRRVAILEKRLPKDKGYQNCLMEVFTSFLRMCGFATEYIKLGRFAKWIKNLLRGDDGELGHAREDMDLKVQNLDQATRFAILRDVVETKKMGEELNRNMEEQKQMLERHASTLRALEARQEAMHADLISVLKAVGSTPRDILTSGMAKVTDRAARKNKFPSASRIRSTLPTVDGDIAEYEILTETIVDGTCGWIFSQPEWLAWVGEGHEGTPGGAPKLLAITGEVGSGKSHIAATVYGHLQQLVDDAGQLPCVAHFYFREQNPSLDKFCNAVITAINQVAEQSPTLCERICTQLERDDVSVDYGNYRHLLHHLLQPCFESETRYRLFLLLDGIDELEDSEQAKLGEFWRTVVDEDLRISLIVTSRSKPADTASGLLAFVGDPAASISTIKVTRELQKSDIAAIVRYQLGNLGSLKRFSPYVKQQISEKIEAIAPNLLYAHHLLHYFDSIGREGAVLGELRKSLPQTLYALYEVMLTTCMRRTVDRYHDAVGVLFCWLAFSLRPLLLDEVVSLLRHVSGDNTLELDDMLELRRLFVRIGHPARGSELAHPSELRYLQTGDVGDPVYEDGRLPVKFRQRAMRSFFCEAAGSAKSEASRQLLMTPSEAHHRIFLATARMARLPSDSSATTLDSGLIQYATLYLMDHWMRIDISEHSLEKRAEIMETLAAVMLNQHHYASITESAGIDYKRDFGDEFLERLALWATEATRDSGLQLSSEARAWWQRVARDPASGLLELAKSQFEAIYQPADDFPTEASYRTARAALIRSGSGDLLKKRALRNFPSIEQPKKATEVYDVLGLAELFDDIPMNATAYGSVAFLLMRYRHLEPARETCSLALSRSPGPVETVMLLCLQSSAELGLGLTQDASRSITVCLSKLEVEEVPEMYKMGAFVLKACIEARLGNVSHAAKWFAKVRTLQGVITSIHALDGEVAIFRNAGDHTGFISALRSWTSSERLTWLTGGWHSRDPTRHLTFQEAAAQAGAHGYIEEVYQDAIKHLEHFNAAAPLRCDLAEAFLLVGGDTLRARQLLDEVLDGSSSGNVYKFTNEDPRTVMQRAVILQSRVLRDLFVRSRDETEKLELLDAVRGLMQRPLPSSVPKPFATALLQHDITAARMTLKMGTRGEFQRRLQNVIDTCFAALNDAVSWNDGPSLTLLAQALVHLSKTLRDGSKLERAARVLLSARFSDLESTVHDDAGDQDGEEEDMLDSDVDYSSEGTPDSLRNSDEAQEAGDDGRESDDGSASTEQKDVLGSGATEQEGDGGQSDEDGQSDEEGQREEDGQHDEDGPSDLEHDDDGQQDEDGHSDEDGQHDEDGESDEDDQTDEDSQQDEDGENADEEDLSQIPTVCAGTICKPTVQLTQWAGCSLYVCIDCNDTAFCKDCYAALEADKDGTAPFQGRRFCGRDHEHIQAPIEGWRGIKDGVMRIEGDEDVPFKEFLRSVREELCKEAWDKFWEG